MLPKNESVLNILVYFLEQLQRYSRDLQPLEYIPLNVLNWFHLQTTRKSLTRKSCCQPEMSGWIHAMQQNTIPNVLQSRWKIWRDKRCYAIGCENRFVMTSIAEPKCKNLFYSSSHNWVKYILNYMSYFHANVVIFKRHSFLFAYLHRATRPKISWIEYLLKN